MHCMRREFLKLGRPSGGLNRKSKPPQQLALTDQQLIERINAGDARKYALLVDRHKDRAFTLALRTVGDRHDAEEIVQDAFVRAYRSLGSFRGDAKFSTWLYRIVYNLCMTRVSRRRPKGEQLDIDEQKYDVLTADESVSSVHEQMETREFRGILVEEVNSLPEKYRVVLTLFYLEEQSYDEIVEVMNLPLGTVKTNLFRGRNLLRERMLTRMKGEMV